MSGRKRCTKDDLRPQRGEKVIVVTGASGLLGVSVVLRARELGREVTGLCHSHLLKISDVPMSTVDLTDADATRAMMRRLHPSCIIHCAAATNVDWCEDHPNETEAINVHASALLAELAAEFGCQLLYVSTDSVFDGSAGGYSEEDEPRPINVYASSKLRGEVETLRRKPDAIVARINIFGWNAQEKQSLAEWVLQQLQSGKRVLGFRDVVFCPMLVNDAAKIFFQMLDAQLGGVYHVVAHDTMSKYEFARHIATEFELDPDLVFSGTVEEAKLRAPRPRNLSLNTNKIETALRRRMPSVADGLGRFKSLYEASYPHRLESLRTGAEAS